MEQYLNHTPFSPAPPGGLAHSRSGLGFFRGVAPQKLDSFVQMTLASDD